MAWHGWQQTPYPCNPFNQPWNNYGAPPPPPPHHGNGGLHPPPPHRPHRSRSYGQAPCPIIRVPSPPHERGRSPHVKAEDIVQIVNVGDQSRSRSRGYDNALLLDMDRERILRRRSSGSKKEEALYAKWKLREMREQHEREEAEKMAVIEHERRIKEKKEEEQRIYNEVLKRQQDEKEAKEKAYKAFEIEQAEKKRKEEEKAKEKEEELEREMRKRLERSNLSQRTIDRLVAKENKKQDLVLVGGRELVLADSHKPRYPMINLKYLEIDTLRYYGYPYEYSREHRNHIIILEEIGKAEVEKLFEHTRQLRGARTAFYYCEEVR
ncbi:hypothetical protein MBLNU457_5650t1 [Dothideomycetes sp. NU457]